MAGRWDQPGIPHSGWRLVHTEDIGEAEHICEMCGQEEIRYVHEVRHPDHPPLRVGCVCAEKMTGNAYAPAEAKRHLVNLAKRRANWLGREWRISSKGNAYLNIEGRNIGVSPDKFHPGGWLWRVGRSFSTITYGTSDEAKLALFDHLARWGLIGRQ